MPRKDPGSTIFFDLTIDGESLGYFNGCEGLVLRGGDRAAPGGRQQRLRLAAAVPGDLLQHPADPPAHPGHGEGRGLDLLHHHRLTRPTAQIAALRADGSVVARWGLIDVLPVSWHGPSLNPENPAVATEVLEITHHGFTD